MLHSSRILAFGFFSIFAAADLSLAQTNHPKPAPKSPSPPPKSTTPSNPPAVQKTNTTPITVRQFPQISSGLISSMPFYPMGGLNMLNPAMNGYPLSNLFTPFNPYGLTGSFGNPFGMVGFNNPLGTNGFNNPLGTNGFNNPLGTNGFNNPLGTNGFNNPLGINGFNNPLGINGFNNPLGINGFNNPLGINGFNNPLGMNGFPPMSWQSNFNNPPVSLVGYNNPMGIGGFNTPVPALRWNNNPVTVRPIIQRPVFNGGDGM